MLRWRLLGLMLVLFVSLSACERRQATEQKEAATPFQVGKDYQLISKSTILPKAEPQEIVQVIEFFNYGCPACYQIEPALEKWLAKKPAYIKFERIPVTFQPEWKDLARVYYLAKLLGVEQRLTPALFRAVQVEAKDLADSKIQAQFFIEHGVKQQDYTDMANFSLGLESQLLRSDLLTQNYQVTVAPTLVIGNRYKLDPSMVEGDIKRFFQVADYLIAKVRQGDT